MESVTPRYARLVGWLLLTGVVSTVFACATPTVEGTDIDSASEGSTVKRNKRASSSSKTTSGDDDDSAPPKTTTPKPTTSTTTAPTTTTPTTPTTPTAPGTTVAPPATTTAPTTTPPPVTQPNCQSGDPLACLNCCLNANPGAARYEDDYDFCLQGCNPGDNACLDACQRQHVSTCSGNASCSANHACMEANNCLAQNFCNPI